MKTFSFIILLLCFNSNIFAQSDFKITDSLVVNDINKSESFENWLEWIALNFNSANNVIQYQSKERGKIILKAILKDDFRTDFTLSLTTKENGWIYSFSNIKSLQYDYDYEKGESDCYTKLCRTNIKKWKESTTNNFNLMIKNISSITLKK